MESKTGFILLFLIICLFFFIPGTASAEVELDIFNRLKLFEQETQEALGPGGSFGEPLWDTDVRLDEKIRLNEILDELNNLAQFTTHEVKPGETLWDISRKHGIDVPTLAGANHEIENIHNIRAGDEIRIMNIRGTVHVVEEGETLSDIASEYAVAPAEIKRVNPGELENLEPGQEVVIPGAQPPDYADRGGSLDSFVWPITGGRISSYFGPRWGGFHEGIDIAVPAGTPIKASKAGWVTFSGWRGGYGNMVEIDHGDGVKTRYAHNTRNLVRPGAFVYQGQVIAYSGNTGNSTGPHLHFEILHNGTPVNPTRYLPPR